MMYNNSKGVGLKDMNVRVKFEQENHKNGEFAAQKQKSYHGIIKTMINLCHRC